MANRILNFWGGVRRSVAFWLVLGTAGTLLLLPAGQPLRAKRAEPALVPHRAVYDLTLGSQRGASNIVSAQGRLVFDFNGSRCDGYTLNIRLVTQVTHRSGSATTSDLRSSTWEQGDGGLFRFSSTEYQDEKLNERANGTAIRSRSREGEGVTVSLSEPNGKKITYSGHVLFPTQHSLEILKAAREGRRLFEALVFDGSDQGKKLYRTTTFVGKKRPAGTRDSLTGKVPNAEVLDKYDSWPVTISYFSGETADGAETPVYELSFILYENGVSRNVTIDYGDFAIRGKLRSLEFFKPNACR